MPRIEEFCERYPDVELMLGFGDRPADPIHEAVDCALRVGQLEDSTLVARRLGSLTTITAESPAYLKRYCEPCSPDELEQHIAVQYFSNRTGCTTGLNFVVDGESTDMKMNGSLAVNDADAYVTCCVNGAGIESNLEAGELKEILKQWKVRSMPLFAVYPHNRHLAVKVRVFAEWMAEICEQSPLKFARNARLADGFRDDGPISTPMPPVADFTVASKLALVAST